MVEKVVEEEEEEKWKGGGVRGEGGGGGEGGRIGGRVEEVEEALVSLVRFRRAGLSLCLSVRPPRGPGVGGVQ